MISINYNNKDYIEGGYILDNAPIYSKGCRSSRDIIKKKNIVSDKYIFARLKDNNWTITDGKSVKFDKVFFKKSFVNSIPELKKDDNKDTIKDDKGIEKAPDIIELDNSDKFKDENNNIIEIETRGERSVDKIYFKVKDVMEGFQMENLNKTIIDKKSFFVDGEHYKYFNCEKVRKNDKKTDNTIKKEVFLTYEGMLRVLFASHSPRVKPFIRWAIETLFTAQLGTPEQKDELASDLLGVNSKTIKDVFKTNTSKTPCVYLYLIGNANKLLNNKYSEDDLLCKFGCTDDLPRRCNEHDKLYSKEFGTKIELLYFSIIEAKYIFNAESNINQYFKSNLIDYKNMNELVVINKKDLPQIKQHYYMIQNSYIGRYEEMHSKISQLEKEIIELNNKILLKDKDIELLVEKHKNEIQNKELELKNKDIEMLHYKIKLLESTNRF